MLGPFGVVVRGHMCKLSFQDAEKICGQQSKRAKSFSDDLFARHQTERKKSNSDNHHEKSKVKKAKRVKEAT